MELIAQDTVVYCLTPLCKMGEVAAVNGWNWWRKTLLFTVWPHCVKWGRLQQSIDRADIYIYIIIIYNNGWNWWRKTLLFTVWPHCVKWGRLQQSIDGADSARYCCLLFDSTVENGGGSSSQWLELIAQDTVVYCLTPVCKMGEVVAVNW